MFLQEPTPSPSQQFDADIVWQVFIQLLQRFLGRLPYLLLGLLVFLVFLVVARILKRTLIVAGRRTRLDLTLADLLGRLASAFTGAHGLSEP